MKYLLSILCLFLFSCDNDTNSQCNNFNYLLNNDNCDFHANINLLDNNEPISQADVFIRYKCNPENEYSWCEESVNLRPSTTIEINLEHSGVILIEAYDLEGNIFDIITDGYYNQGNFTFIFEPPLPPFGFGAFTIKTTIVYDDGNIYENQQTLYLITAPDFQQLENLGQTDEMGLFELGYEYRKWIPTFFNLPEVAATDEFGNHLGNFYLDDITNGFESIFLYQDTYKIFDINLKDSYFDYNFDWQNGEIFIP